MHRDTSHKALSTMLEAGSSLICVGKLLIKIKSSIIVASIRTVSAILITT